MHGGGVTGWDSATQSLRWLAGEILLRLEEFWGYAQLGLQICEVSFALYLRHGIRVVTGQGSQSLHTLVQEGRVNVQNDSYLRNSLLLKLTILQH